MTLTLKNPSLLKAQAFINGEWIDSTDQFAVHNPATGEIICELPNLGAEHTRAAISAAESVMKNWKSLAAKKRCHILETWQQLLLDNLDDLAKIMTAEQGKTLAESKGEVAYGAAYIKWFAEEGKRVYGDIIPSTPDRRGLVIKQPVGVVAAITPWNFPNAMIARKAAPALAVGCAMVLKPAAETPLSALAMAELAQKAGLPDGLLNVITSTQSSSVGAEMTSNPTVKKLTFTGSTPVGKLLMKQCADTMKRTSMELGGNAPIIIFNDANLDLAVQGALTAKYRNSGQTCICANRLLVQEDIYPAFVEKLVAEVKNFRIGNGFAEDSTHGPVINAKAAQQIDELVQSAVEEGANIEIGGGLDQQGDCFYQPTVLSNVNDSMRVFHEEIFGPVAPVFKFSTEEEAITMANNTNFGLASYVYTENLSRIWRVSEAIEYGMVGVNETAISSEVIPFGGVKESGQGREGSKYGLDDYLETKYICIGGIQ